MKILFILLFALSLQGQVAVPITNFGMHANSVNNWPPLNVGAFRLWDTGTQWAQTETSAGVYNFSRIDAYIAEAHANGVTDIIYNPSMTPTFYSSHPTDSTCAYSQFGIGWCWAPTDVNSGDNHFKNFLIALINHVGPGVIKYWEGWNEPNGIFWNDSTSNLLQMQTDLYNTVHAQDPTAKVLFPPGFSGGGAGTKSIQDMLASGFGSFADINTFHSKKCNPEDDVSNTTNVKSLFSGAGFGSRELWNTEGGWQNSTNCPNPPHPEKVARLYLLNWSQGINRYYWYSYDNTAWGQLGTGQTLNTAGVAYREVENWMLGRTMTAQASVSGTVWHMDFSGPSGYASRAVWNTAGSSTYTPPGGTYRQYRDLAGHTNTLGSTVGIGISPILLENTGLVSGSGIDDVNVAWTQPNAGWKFLGVGCVKPNCDPGGTGIPTSSTQTFGNASPSLDGASMKVSVTGPAFTNALWPFVAGVNDLATYFKADFWVNPSANFATAAQTFETDQFLFSTGLNKQFMFGTQCNQVAGFWQVWDMLDFKWFNSVVPCSGSTGVPPSTWTHIIQTAHRIAGDTNQCSGQPCMYYDTITINGVTKNYGTGGPIKEPAGPLPVGWLSDVGWQPQIDIGSAAATVSLNFDQVSFTAYTPTPPLAPTSLSVVTQ